MEKNCEGKITIFYSNHGTDSNSHENDYNL